MLSTLQFNNLKFIDSPQGSNLLFSFLSYLIFQFFISLDIRLLAIRLPQSTGPDPEDGPLDWDLDWVIIPDQQIPGPQP